MRSELPLATLAGRPLTRILWSCRRSFFGVVLTVPFHCSPRIVDFLQGVKLGRIQDSEGWRMDGADLGIHVVLDGKGGSGLTFAGEYRLQYTFVIYTRYKRGADTETRII